MRIRILILASFLAVVVGAGALQGGEVPRTYVENVSTFICPAKNRDMSGSIHLADKSAKSAVIDGKNRTLKKSKSRQVPLGQKARVVAGDTPTPLVVASKQSTWLALSQCSASAGEFWFVGGTSDVTSLGYFQFINENLGKAIIDVELWSEDGSESTRTLTIPPRSTKNYSLTTFMPGKKRTVFHIVSRSGLIKATLFDERRKGLQTYGGDFVAPATNPSQNMVIPGIPGSKFVKKSKITSQKLRIFVPGESDSILQVTYISPSGVFAPIGLDSLRIPSQKVVEIDLGNLPKSRLFSIKLRSTEPTVAAVLTRGTFGKNSKISEISWSTSTNISSGEQMTLPERTGWLSIVSESPKVSFTVVGSRGKKSSVTVKVDSMAVWKVPRSVRQIQFTEGSAQMYLGFSTQDSSGVSTTALAPALGKEVTALPVVDSRLFIPTA
jgi:hypothetical protein